MIKLNTNSYFGCFQIQRANNNLLVYKGYISLKRFEIQTTVMLNDKINHISYGNHIHKYYFEAYLIL